MKLLLFMFILGVTLMMYAETKFLDELLDKNINFAEPRNKKGNPCGKLNIPGGDCEYGEISGLGKDQDIWNKKNSPGKRSAGEETRQLATMLLNTRAETSRARP